MQAYVCTGGLGASSRVALASLPGALSSTDVSLLPDITWVSGVFQRANFEEKKYPFTLLGIKERG